MLEMDRYRPKEGNLRATIIVQDVNRQIGVFKLNLCLEIPFVIEVTNSSAHLVLK